jgi:hypothetical protein
MPLFFERGHKNVDLKNRFNVNNLHPRGKRDFHNATPM